MEMKNCLWEAENGKILSTQNEYEIANVNQKKKSEQDELTLTVSLWTHCQVEIKLQKLKIQNEMSHKKVENMIAYAETEPIVHLKTVHLMVKSVKSKLACPTMPVSD